MVRKKSARAFTVMSAALSLLGVASAVAQPTVSFGIEDYAELGLVREAVRSGYEEVNDARLDMQSALNYGSLAEQAVSNVGDLTSFSMSVSDAATLYFTISKLIEIVNAQSIQDLVDTLSPLDVSRVTVALENVRSSLQTLNSQTLDPIQPPYLYTYYAVAVSNRARELVVELRGDANSGRASLLTALNNTVALTALLQQYQLQLSQAAIAAQELAEILIDLLPIPGVGIVAYSMLANVIAIQGQIYDLRVNHVPATLRELGTSETRVEQRIGELDVLVESLDFALTAAPLTSSWTTSADVGASNPWYILAFTGDTFTRPYTEIDGPFLLGTLSIENLYTPCCPGFPPPSTLVLNVVRVVNDPLIGPQITPASVSLDIQYVVTSPPDLCGIGRDYFSIPSLGINVFMCELDTRTFRVYGQYDSPLRVVAIEALPSNVDPEPAVDSFAFTLQVTGGIGSGVYSAGDIVHIEAVPPKGRQFVSWAGDVEFLADPTSSITTVSVPEINTNVEALFLPQREEFHLVVVNGTGTGIMPPVQRWAFPLRSLHSISSLAGRATLSFYSIRWPRVHLPMLKETLPLKHRSFFGTIVLRTRKNWRPAIVVVAGQMVSVQPTAPSRRRRWEIAAFPFVWQPLGEPAHGRGREVDQELRQVPLRVDVVAAAGAGQTRKDRRGAAAALVAHEQ